MGVLVQKQINSYRDPQPRNVPRRRPLLVRPRRLYTRNRPNDIILGGKWKPPFIGEQRDPKPPERYLLGRKMETATIAEDPIIAAARRTISSWEENGNSQHRGRTLASWADRYILGRKTGTAIIAEE